MIYWFLLQTFPQTRSAYMVKSCGRSEDPRRDKRRPETSQRADGECLKCWPQNHPSCTLGCFANNMQFSFYITKVDRVATVMEIWSTSPSRWTAGFQIQGPAAAPLPAKVRARGRKECATHQDPRRISDAAMWNSIIDNGRIIFILG